MLDENKKKEVLVDVKDLTVQFGSRRHPFTAVDKATFQIYKGETFGLVGESGSGKTTIGRAIIRINPTAGGEVIYNGQKINGKISKELDKEVTQKIQMIFQDPMASLNERAKVDYIVAEGLLNLPKKLSKEERQALVSEALDEVGLLPEFASRFPHEFSGGQRQRIGIARAMIMRPEFIIADEPISALDVSIRAQVLNLMSKFQREYDLTYLFISHDLSVMRFICDRICVIHKGVLVELAERRTQFDRHGVSGRQPLTGRHEIHVDGIAGTPYAALGPDESAQPLLELFARDVERRGREFRAGIDFQIGSLLLFGHDGIIGTTGFILHGHLPVAIGHTPPDALPLIVAQFDVGILDGFGSGDAVNHEGHAGLECRLGNHPEIGHQQVALGGSVEVVAGCAGIFPVAPVVGAPVILFGTPVVSALVELTHDPVETVAVGNLGSLRSEPLGRRNTGQRSHRAVEREGDTVQRAGFGFEQLIEV